MCLKVLERFAQEIQLFTRFVIIVFGCRKNIEEKQLENKLDNKNGKVNQLNVIQC